MPRVVLAPPPFRAELPASDAQRQAKTMLRAFGWGDEHWEPLRHLWDLESGWRTNAVNPSSGACGIPQALPCEKIPGGRNSTADAQVRWGMSYIAHRYGSPSAAWAHSQATGWY